MLEYFYNLYYKVEMWNKYQIIHPSVLKSLHQLQFNTPTQIQKQVLQNYKYYYDFLLASQTGSGKTLAFGIPIISQLLTKMQQNQQQSLGLCCLILTPTRQLALQIQEHLNNINFNKRIRITTIIGGLSKQKQLRVLTYKPQIIIATPGRLNQLIEQQNQYIKLHTLRYLVIDEADRMIQLGHFREVDNILAKIFDQKTQKFDKQLLQQQINIEEQEQQGGNLYIKDKSIKLDINKLETDKLIQLPDDFYKFFQAKPKKFKKQKKQDQKDKQRQQIQQQVTIKQQKKQKVQKKKKKKEQPIKKQIQKQRIKKKIFLVSATLTKQFKDTKYYTKNNEKQIKEKQKTGTNNQMKLFDTQLTPKLKSLVSRLKFTSKPKVIDLSSVFLLPQHINSLISYCDDQEQKLVHLICYIEQTLKKSAQKKKILIFTNTIKASKRISSILNLIGHTNIILHSNMQQRQRLSKMQKFVKNINNILICTDLAARGLDMIIDVVIQYGVPLNGDTYVHRLGRTGRAGRSGQNLLIVGKTQYSKWKDILNVLNQNKSIQGTSIRNYLVNIKHMNDVKQKIKLAEIALKNNKEVDLQRSNKWLQKEAEQIDIIIDDPKKNSSSKNKNNDTSESKRLIKKIYIPKKMNEAEQQSIKWKKNKMVLNVNDIQTYMSKLINK